MTEGTDPAAEVLAIIADLAEAGAQASWQQWDATVGVVFPWELPAWTDVREVHRAGFIAGMAFLAGQVDAVLETIESRAAAPGAPVGEPELGFVPGRFAGPSGLLRRARRRPTRG